MPLRRACVLILLLPFPAAQAKGPGLQRGAYYETGGQRFFLPCGARQPLTLVDETPGAELHGAYATLVAPEERLFVELRSRARGGKVTALVLERAQAKGAGCREVLRNSLFKAAGSVPLWNLYIDYTGLRIKTLADGRPVHFPYRRHRREDGAWVYETRNGHGTLQVKLTRERCHDGDSGALYSYRAEVDYAGQRLKGCAYTGLLFR